MEHIDVLPSSHICYHPDWHNPPADCPNAVHHFNANCKRHPCTLINQSTRVWGSTPRECRTKIRAHWADTETHPPEDLLGFLALL